MRQLINGLRWIAIWALFTPIVVHTETVSVDSPAFAIYVKTIYPYMRTNCALCHDENATYPSGPEHSNSNPQLAFPVFFRFINFDNPTASQLVKMAGTHHFCNSENSSYNDKCSQSGYSEQTGDNIKKLVAMYVNEVKKTGGAAVTTTALTAPSPSYQGLDVKLPFDPQGTVTTDNIQVSGSNQQRFSYNLSTLNNRRKLLVNFTLTRFEGNFYRLSQLTLESDGGIFNVQGIHLLINDRPLITQTGFERIHRAVYFNVNFDEVMDQVLALNTPTIQVKAGDQIKLSFDQLAEMQSYPELLCSNMSLFKEMWVQFDTAIGSSIDSRLHIHYPKDSSRDKERCYELESHIDVRNPRRSTLLSGLSGKEATQWLDLINLWLVSYQR